MPFRSCEQRREKRHLGYVNPPGRGRVLSEAGLWFQPSEDRCGIPRRSLSQASTEIQGGAVAVDRRRLDDVTVRIGMGCSARAAPPR